MRAHTVAEAAAVVDLVEDWQPTFLAALGRRVVFAADEYYLLAGRPFPALDELRGLAQHENGDRHGRRLRRRASRAAGRAEPAAPAGSSSPSTAPRPRATGPHGRPAA